MWASLTLCNRLPSDLRHCSDGGWEVWWGGSALAPGVITANRLWTCFTYVVYVTKSSSWKINLCLFQLNIISTQIAKNKIPLMNDRCSSLNLARQWSTSGCLSYCSCGMWIYQTTHLHILLNLHLLVRAQPTFLLKQQLELWAAPQSLLRLKPLLPVESGKTSLSL